jgi:hypothetical protein
MKIRQRIRFKMLPSDLSFGWKNFTPVVRMTSSEANLAAKFEIGLAGYAKEKLKRRGA